MICTTSIPLTTRPNTVCLLSSHGYEAKQENNNNLVSQKIHDDNYDDNDENDDDDDDEDNSDDDDDDDDDDDGDDDHDDGDDDDDDGDNDDDHEGDVTMTIDCEYILILAKNKIASDIHALLETGRTGVIRV